MIDKIVVLNDKTKIFILDEIEYKNKKFVFGVEYDSLKEEITENYYVLEVDIINDKLSLKDIDDEKTIVDINNIFLSRIKNI